MEGFLAPAALKAGSISLIQHMALSMNTGSFTSFLSLIFSFAICSHFPAAVNHVEHDTLKSG